MGISKGQGGVILLMGIVAAAMVAGIVSAIQVQRLPSIYQNYVNDAPPIAQSEVRNDMLEKNFFGLAAYYAVSEATYELGKDGHSDINPSLSPPTREGDNDDYNDDDRHAEVAKYEEVLDKASEMSNNKYEDYDDEFDTISYGTSCQAELAEVDIALGFEDDDIVITPEGDFKGLTNVTCEFPSGKVVYEGRDAYEKTNMGGNRFHDMASMMDITMTEMENVSEEIEHNDNDHGSFSESTTCDYDSETAAENEFYSQVSDRLDNIKDAIETAILRKNHGIGSGGERGAKKAIDENIGGQICLWPFGCMNWEPFDGLFDDIDSDQLERVSIVLSTDYNNVETNQCDCAGGWECGGADYTDSYWSADPNGDNTDATCEHSKESETADCDFNDDFTHDGSGSCDYTSTSPTADCDDPGYSWNSTIEQCQYFNDETDTKDPVCTDSYDDGDSDSDSYDFIWTGNNRNCEFDETNPEPVCSWDDVEHDDNGGCQLSNGRPDASCSDWDYDAEGDVDWELTEFKADIGFIHDGSMGSSPGVKIPNDYSGTPDWDYLEFDRRYVRDVWEGP